MRPELALAYLLISDSIQSLAAPMPRVVLFCVLSVWRVPNDTSFLMVASMFFGSISFSMVLSSFVGFCGINSVPTLEGGHAAFAQLV